MFLCQSVDLFPYIINKDRPSWDISSVFIHILTDSEANLLLSFTLNNKDCYIVLHLCNVTIGFIYLFIYDAYKCL